MREKSGCLFFERRRDANGLKAAMTPRGVLLGLLLIDDLLEVLHETDDVAHTEDPRREAAWHESLESVDLLARTDELDRQARDLADRQGHTTPRIAVRFREDHSSQRHGLVERPRRVDGVLAGHRIHHEQAITMAVGYRSIASTGSRLDPLMSNIALEIMMDQGTETGRMVQLLRLFGESETT